MGRSGPSSPSLPSPRSCASIPLTASGSDPKKFFGITDAGRGRL